MTVPVGRAIKALNVNQFRLVGEPTNQTEFNEMFSKVIGEDSNGSAIMSTDPADFGITWSQVAAKLTELQNAEPTKLLRKERDRKLTETDWWASSDLTMTTEQTNYRQALRDITDTYSSLDTVVWPEKP